MSKPLSGHPKSSLLRLPWRAAPGASPNPVNACKATTCGWRPAWARRPTRAAPDDIIAPRLQGEMKGRGTRSGPRAGYVTWEVAFLGEDAAPSGDGYRLAYAGLQYRHPTSSVESLGGGPGPACGGDFGGPRRPVCPAGSRLRGSWYWPPPESRSLASRFKSRGPWGPTPSAGRSRRRASASRTSTCPLHAPPRWFRGTVYRRCRPVRSDNSRRRPGR